MYFGTRKTGMFFVGKQQTLRRTHNPTKSALHLGCVGRTNETEDVTTSLPKRYGLVWNAKKNKTKLKIKRTAWMLAYDDVDVAHIAEVLQVCTNDFVVGEVLAGGLRR